MPAQVLVMCDACGRPQFAVQPNCIACGAKLPEVPVTPPKDAREKLLAGFEPLIEANLGRGRVLFLSQKRLEWREGSRPPRIWDLGKVAEVALRRRPPWESLIITAVALVPLIWVKWVAFRLLLAGIALLGAAACLLQKRVSLRVRLDGGQHADIPLGVGTPRAPIVQRADSVWGALGPELARLGVPVDPPARPG